MGNVLESSLEEIWLGDAFRQLRIENLSKNFKRFSACEKCETRATYKMQSNEKGIDIGYRSMYIFKKDEDR